MDDMNGATERDVETLPKLIQGLKRLVIATLVTCLIASGASMAGSVLSYFHGKDKRGEICEFVSQALDNYTDALVATVADPADSPAVLAERARKTQFLKSTFHGLLKNCD